MASRQRIEQILSKAESRGQIKRVETSGERGQHIYLSASAAFTEIMERTPGLSESRRKLLSSMAPGEIYYVTELAAAPGAPSTTQLKSWIAGLANWGLVYRFEIGIKMFCGVTPQGVTYPDYDELVTKAKSVNFADELGAIKSRFLQAMRVLGGTARTIELTYALDEEMFDGMGYSSGQVMQRLEIIGLIQRSKADRNKKQGAFRLTRTGEYVASVIDRYIAPPTEQELLDKIERRVQLKAEKLREAWGHSSEFPLVQTQRAILKVLVSEHQICTQLIPEKMEVKFENPRSINLAMKTMEERGYIVRVGERSRNGVIWQATEKGFQALSNNDGEHPEDHSIGE